jgi:hypothetical protein
VLVFDKMPVGFGFGVGDLIATINLFNDVAVALKDHGGALDDYQKTLAHLESMRAILMYLANASNQSRTSASLTSIHNSAMHIKDEVENFLANINKYKARLGSQTSGNSFTKVK